MRKFWLGLLLVNVLLYWAVIPLLEKGYFPMHDDTQVARVIVMGNALAEKQFPVRIVNDLGYNYGYTIFNYYSPLPYYVGGALYALGLDPFTATKIMFLVPFFLGASFLFIFLTPAFGIIGALVGSIIFSYAPYHAVQVYVRGSVGEYWAIAFVPLILWGCSLLSKTHAYKGIILGSIGFFGVITSHTILGVMTLLYYVFGMLIFMVYSISRQSLQRKVLMKACLLVLFGLGLSAFFWLPALIEMRHTSVSTMIEIAQTGFYEHFLCFSQLWNSPWGFGGSAIGCVNDGMSFKLGKIHSSFGVLSILVFLWMWYRRRTKLTSFRMFVGISLLLMSIFGMIDTSSALWRLFPFTSFIQYPWRLLSFTMLSLGIVSAYIPTLIRNSYIKYTFATVIIGITIYSNAKIFVPKYIFNPSADMFAVSDIRFRVSKISDEYLPTGIVRPQSLEAVPSGIVKGGALTNLVVQSQSANNVKVHVESIHDDTVVFLKAYFPGWKFWIDGTEAKPDIIHGLPEVFVPKGNHLLEATFSNTPVRSQGNIISIVSLILLGGLLFYGQKTKA